MHSLKIEIEYFDQILNGNKMFEIRLNDRDFKVGDYVYLTEIDVLGEYTPRAGEFQITYVTDFEQKEGYVVFGIRWSTRPRD